MRKARLHTESHTLPVQPERTINPPLKGNEWVTSFYQEDRPKQVIKDWDGGYGVDVLYPELDADGNVIPNYD